VMAASGDVAVPGDGMVTSSWQLPSMILRAAGVPGDAYFDFVSRIGPGLAADDSSPRGMLLKDGLYAAANARLQDRFDDYARN